MEKNFTDANFEAEVVNSDKPVMVDLWAPWCGPCRMLGPVVEELAHEYEGRVKVGKLNTDENPMIASALRVSAVPTVLFVKGGQVVDAVVGVQPKAALKARLDALLA